MVNDRFLRVVRFRLLLRCHGSSSCLLKLGLAVDDLQFGRRSGTLVER